jgi:chorismate mutase
MVTQVMPGVFVFEPDVAETVEQIRAIDKQVFDLGKLRAEYMERIALLREQVRQADPEEE